MSAYTKEDAVLTKLSGVFRIPNGKLNTYRVWSFFIDNNFVDVVSMDRVYDLQHIKVEMTSNITIIRNSFTHYVAGDTMVVTFGHTDMESFDYIEKLYEQYKESNE